MPIPRCFDRSRGRSGSVCERVLSLDAKDHRTYANLVDLLAAAGQPEATIGGYAEPPSGNFTTFFLRIPARTWNR